MGLQGSEDSLTI